MRGVHVTLRMRLECRIVRRGGDGRAGLEEVYEVLNEVVVDRGANPFLTKIECWERDRLITKAWQQLVAHVHILLWNMRPCDLWRNCVDDLALVDTRAYAYWRTAAP